VVLTIDANNRWFLHGHSNQEGVSAGAYCFRKDDFYAPGPFRDVVTHHYVKSTGGCVRQSQNIEFGDALSYLVGMGGGFRGLGEYADISQARSNSTQSSLSAQACGSNSVWAYGASFYAGDARFTYPGQEAEFWGPLGKGNVAEAGMFTAEAYTYLDRLVEGYAMMTPVADTMCVFTHIGGDFAGGGEATSIDIEDVNGRLRWVLRARSSRYHGGDFLSTLQASARCYARQQHPNGSCTSSVKSACAAYGCGCVGQKCTGGACPGTGCSARQFYDCEARGCGCRLGQCTGGACAR
jgi:hypothetical protein